MIWLSRANRSTRRRVLKYLSDGEWRTWDEIKHGAGVSIWRWMYNGASMIHSELIEQRDEVGTGRKRTLYRINPRYLEKARYTVL